jgi:hypothetical protein
LVVNCRTEEKAKEFLKLLTVMGYTGLVRESLLNYINWSRYEENTCYNILGMHGSINRYKKYGFKIVQW